MNLVFLTTLFSVTIQPISVILTPDNHVSVKGRIDRYMASSFISKINQINSTNIYVYIDSPGGDVESGQKMIQYLISFYVSWNAVWKNSVTKRKLPETKKSLTVDLP